MARVMRGPPSMGGRLFFHDRRRPRSRRRPSRPRAARRGHQSRRSPRPGERRAGATPPHRPTVLIGRWRGASAGRQRRRRGPTTAPPRRRSAAVVAVASCVICNNKKEKSITRVAAPMSVAFAHPLERIVTLRTKPDRLQSGPGGSTAPEPPCDARRTCGGTRTFGGVPVRTSCLAGTPPHHPTFARST